MKKISLVFIGLILLAGLQMIPRAAQAGVSFDFLFSTNSVSDDNQYYLNLAVSNYGYPRPVLEPVLPRIRYVEQDLPVVLFLANVSGRPVDAIVDLRCSGLGWSVIFSRCGVPYDVLFADIDRDPGPPYGKAWGHWKKNPKRCVLSDSDIANFVNVQIGHRVCGVPAYEIAHARSSGKPIAAFVADKKGRPHGNRQVAKSPKSSRAVDGEVAAKSGGSKQGGGKHSEGKGGGKGKGNGKGNH